MLWIIFKIKFWLKRKLCIDPFSRYFSILVYNNCLFAINYHNNNFTENFYVNFIGYFHVDEMRRLFGSGNFIFF